MGLAGVSIPNFMDGRSMVPWLVSKDVIVESTQRGADSDTQWRDRLLIEYLSVGTYYNDHSNAWQDGKKTTAKCGGGMPRGPAGAVKTCTESEGIGDGNCYFVDSKHSNSWRALRIITKSENLQYIEYDPSWLFNATGPSGEGLQHYELYNIDKDPYQMHNVYNQTDASKRAELHSAISQYFNCKGDDKTPSTCKDADRGVLFKPATAALQYV